MKNNLPQSKDIAKDKVILAVIIIAFNRKIRPWIHRILLLKSGDLPKLATILK